MKTNVNTDIKDLVAHRSAMTRLYEKRVVDRIEDTLLDHHKSLVEKVKSGRLDRVTAKVLMENGSKAIEAAYKQAYRDASRSLLELASDQMGFMHTTLDDKIGNLFKVKKPSLKIPEDIVLKRPLYKERALKQIFLGLSINERKRFEKTIRRGLGKGADEATLIKQVQKDFRMSRNHAEAMVITSFTSVKNQSDLEVYKANSAALNGWQYIAVLDSRTTPICVARDAEIYGVDDVEMLPPAHIRCRSTTIPAVKSYADLAILDAVAGIRRRNLSALTPAQIAYYDGQAPIKESYDQWLRRQNYNVQKIHLGSSQRVALYREGQLTVDKFVNEYGASIGMKELRLLTTSGISAPGDTSKFALAKEKLNMLKLWAVRPDDFFEDTSLVNNLREYYKLQAKDLEGTLSLTNYRGITIANKKRTKAAVLQTPPREEQLVYNPITGRYEDTRLYQPNPAVLINNLRLVDEAEDLLGKDKAFITSFVNSLEDYMSVNERAVVADNLRIVFTRYRKNKEPWGNLKAVLNSQIAYDVTNVSDYVETQLRSQANPLKKLKQEDFIDPVLGSIPLDDLYAGFIPAIRERNRWEDIEANRLAKRLQGLIDMKIPTAIRVRLSPQQRSEVYLKLALRLAKSDMPDRDQLAVALGRDIYTLANWRASKDEWLSLGTSLLNDAQDKGIFKLETYGVQKRRMKSRISGALFGPYYDTFSVNIRIVDPKLQEYAKNVRKVDVGLRLGVLDDERTRLYIRPGFKTYFLKKGLVYEDTRIPIISASSYHDFPTEMIDKNMADALNWASSSRYKVDNDFHAFMTKLLAFKDDKGKAKYFDSLNEYREYILSRGDAYERFKAMDWLVKKDASFSHHAFVDHRGRVYERGFIGPQAGETFRPYLNTLEAKSLGVEGFLNVQDQIGGFLGGLSDFFEGRYNSLTTLGRQRIAEKWRKDLVEIGSLMLSGKPNDIRKILENKLLHQVDGEEQGKFLRFAIEAAKIDRHLEGNYGKASLVKLSNYRTALALEQDASSSGAQIIALTTKNKQLAELSNVVPTNQKRRLYDEIAEATFNDPRFIRLNEKLGLTEKDLRKAAKAQNMVTFYGAGQRTGIMNVENKLKKALGKDDNLLVVTAGERDKVLAEISAKAARYKAWDEDTYRQLMALRKDVRDIFNKGTSPGDDIMEALYFLDNETRFVLEKMSRNYNNVVTPDDFKQIALIMSEYLSQKVPILSDFTKYFGRLAEAFFLNAKPSDSKMSMREWIEYQLFSTNKKPIKLFSMPKLPKLEWKPFNERTPKSNAIKRAKRSLVGSPSKPPKWMETLPFWNPDGALSKLFFGIAEKRLPKSWTTVPWVNFDGKTVEQPFTQSYQTKLIYKDKDGNPVINFVNIEHKSEPTWWETLMNKTGTINDIADIIKAKTAYAVNGNHSNDAVLVKQFHLWGKKNGIPTSTVHDAFFTNVSDMVTSKRALRDIYATMAERSTVKATLDEMYKRGLPKSIYDQFLNEAIEKGIIPVPGRSRVGGKILQEEDLLTLMDMQAPVKGDFTDNKDWYGIGP